MTVLRALSLRPGLIVGLGACRLLSAWLVALPVLAQLRTTGLGHLADGDRALFVPGSLILPEVLAKHGDELGAALGASAAIFCAMWVLLLAPFTLLLVGLAAPGRLTVDDHGRATLRALPSVAFIACATFLVQVMLVTLGVVALVIIAALADPSTPTLKGSFWMGGFCFLSALWLGVGLVREIAYCAAVTGRAGLLRALAVSLAVLRDRAAAVLARYALFLAASGLLVAATALAADLVDVSAPGAYRVLLAVAVHQLTLLALLALRAGWLTSSLELVSSWSRAPGGKRERSAATDDPSPDLDASSALPIRDNAPN